MPPKIKRSKASGRAPNQPSLLSFWGAANPKSSSSQTTEKGTTAKPSTAATHHPNVGIRPMFQHKKRRVSFENEIKEPCAEKSQPNSPIPLLQRTALSSTTETPRQASMTEKGHHAVSPDISSNALPQNSRQSSPSHMNIPVKSPATPENNVNSSDIDEKGKDQELLESSSAPLLAPAKTRDNNPPGLSDYELLRLRNIARNNARLEALGLLHNPMTVTHQKANRTVVRRSTKKRPNNHKAFHSRPSEGPKRRSTRLSQPKSGTGPRAMDANDSAVIPETKHTQEEEEEEETYTVSPLVQYEMNTNTTRVSTSSVLGADHKGTETGETMTSETSAAMSLIPSGQRFAAPQGLSAIYSLNFCPKGTWLVGAGKAGIVALWNCSSNPESCRIEEDRCEHHKDGEIVDRVDPIFSWKAHNGRWISEAQFLDISNNNESSMTAAATTTTTTTPSRLVTAANDGTVCLWDLSKVSTASGTPKILQRSNKSWHSSGIFAMDTTTTFASQATVKIATASKDKTVAITSDLETFSPTWRSYVHSAKVGAVKFRDEHVLASASDDGCVAILDDRMKDKDAAPVALLEGLHNGRPHSVVWNHHQAGGGSTANIFLTAGLDSVIQAWDSRYLTKGSDGLFCPVAEYVGHVPISTRRCKRIHHPVFFRPFQHRNKNSDCFVLTGGEGSHSLSLFAGSCNTAPDSSAVEPHAPLRAPVLSRGLLPPDCNHADVGSISIYEDRVAASVDGEVLLLKPSM